MLLHTVHTLSTAIISPSLDASNTSPYSLVPVVFGLYFYTSPYVHHTLARRNSVLAYNDFTSTIVSSR